jgi:RHS repeat-associated protein
MPNTTTATMSYDAADQRTGKSGGAQGGYLTMSLEGSHVEAVYGCGGTLSEKYLRGSTTDELVAGFILEGTNKPLPKLYRQDHIGGISAITDHKGGVMQSFTYSAFGQVQRAAGGGIARLKYTGRDDDETGLYYYRARYYDPRIGRFISEDPMGYGAGDVSFYAYANNNPVNGNDPSGNEPVITRNGNAFNILFRDVHISVPPPLDPQVMAQRIVGNVQEQLTGTFARPGGLEPYTSTATVNYTAGVNARGTGPNAWNITVVNANSFFDLRVGNSPLNGSFTASNGRLPAQMMLASGMAPNTPVHEFLHGIGLPASHDYRSPDGNTASYEAGNIGAARLGPGNNAVVDYRNFDQMLSVPGLVGTGGLSASGGFLLYPNKPNNNQARGVYQK